MILNIRLIIVIKDLVLIIYIYILNCYNLSNYFNYISFLFYDK